MTTYQKVVILSTTHHFRRTSGSGLAKQHFKHSDIDRPQSATQSLSPDKPTYSHHQSGVTKSRLNRP